MSAYFIPVAVNLYEVRADRGPAGDLFRSAQRQHDQYQGLWLLDPDGKVLAAHHAPRRPESWIAEVLAAIDAALAASGDVAPRIPARDDPLRYRGRGVRPDGSVGLALSVRLTFQGKPQGDGALDEVRLSAADWAAFAPPEPVAGRAWALPERVGRAFSRCLSPASDQSTMPRPEEVTDVAFAGRVVDVQGTVARVVYTGRIAATHVYDGKSSRCRARFTGLGTCDTATRSLRSLTLLAEGVYGAPPPYAEDRPIAAAVEWRADDRPPAVTGRP